MFGKDCIKVARFYVSPELLADILSLPKGTEIRNVRMEHDRAQNAIEFTVISDTLPDQCSVTEEMLHNRPVIVDPQYREDKNGRVAFVKWVDE